MEHYDETTIFQEYVEKRLKEDHSFGMDDFPITQSSSLNLLSSVSGVQIQGETKTKLQIEDDGYEKQKYVVADITPLEFIEKRAQNIENMAQHLPSALAEKIKKFEELTKYLYVRDIVSREDVLENLEQAKKLFRTKTTENTEIKKLIDNHKLRIAPGLSRKAQSQAKASSKATQNQARFYALIKDIYKPKSVKDLCAQYEELDKLAPYANLQDLAGFVYQKTFSETAKLKARFTKELRRDIAEKILKLYAYFASPDDLDAQQKKVNRYNKSCDKFHTIEETGYKSLLGPKGAFEEGGLYGSDSKFAGNTPQPQNAPTPQTTTPQTPPPPQPSKAQTQLKPEKIIELSLFSDRDFEP